MDTIPKQVVTDGRRRRRKHTDEFKSQVVAACSQPGVSIAAVSMAHGVNANLARRWITDAEQLGGSAVAAKSSALARSARPGPVSPQSFVPVQVPGETAKPDIRVELRRGATAISVTWPISAASECAAWLRELLR